MIFKNIKMTNRDWYLFIGFIVYCILVASMVGNMIIYASTDHSDLKISQIECKQGYAILPAGAYSTADVLAIINLCNNKYE